MAQIEIAESRGIDTDPYRVCIADTSRPRREPTVRIHSCVWGTREQRREAESSAGQAKRLKHRARHTVAFSIEAAALWSVCPAREL